MACSQCKTKAYWGRYCHTEINYVIYKYFNPYSFALCLYISLYFKVPIVVFMIFPNSYVDYSGASSLFLISSSTSNANNSSVTVTLPAKAVDCPWDVLFFTFCLKSDMKLFLLNRRWFLSGQKLYHFPSFLSYKCFYAF